MLQEKRRYLVRKVFKKHYNKKVECDPSERFEKEPFCLDMGKVFDEKTCECKKPKK